MNRLVVLSATLVAMIVCGATAAVFVVRAGSRDTLLLLAAIFGFLTPTVASLLSLLKTTDNSQAVAQVSGQVDVVNQKVNGHLARLTQIVVDSAAREEPVSVIAAALLAQRTEILTGLPISHVPQKADPSDPHAAPVFLPVTTPLAESDAGSTTARSTQL
jgi:ascorbate-specific PTS system EIIC-type component UlaA